MSETDITAPDAMAIGSRLAGTRVAAAEPARSGGNNRVFRLQMAEGPPLALKHYPSDGRDRLGQEYDALSFLARPRHHVDTAAGREGRAMRSARCTNGSTAKPRCCAPKATMPISSPIS